MSDRFAKTTVRVLVLALLYFVAGRLGLMLPAFGSHITLIWFPTGIAVAALLRWGFPCWPGVTLGAVAVNLASGITWPTVMGIAMGNTAGPLLAAWILLRAGFRPTFDRKRDILFLSMAALAGMLVSASVGTAMLALSGDLPSDALRAWLIWWGGDTMGVIAAAPLLLTFTRQEWRIINHRRGEFLLWLCATGFTVVAVFALSKTVDGHVWTLSFLPLPLAAWAALRFGATGTSLAIIMFSVGAAYGTATQRGPLQRADPGEGAAVLWLFMATAAVLGWLISALHAAREKVAGIQNLLEEALSDLSLGVLLGDLDLKIAYANTGFTRLTGYTEDELEGKSWRVLHGPGTDPVVSEMLGAALAGDGYFDGEILNYRKDGTPFWNALLISPVHNARGDRTGFLSVQRDISQRRKTDAALRESEERFRRLINNAPEGIVLMDAATGRFIEANPTAELLFKLSAAELCKVGPAEMSPPTQPDGRPSREKGRGLISMALAGETPVFEWTHRDAEGRDIPCEVRLLRFEIGGRVVVRGSITDITARVRAEAALNASYKFSDSLIRSMQDGLSVLDANGVHLDVNPAFCTMTGFSREELLGVGPPHPYWPPEEREHIETALTETLKGNFSDFELTFMHKNGERFPAIISPSEVRNAEGTTINYLATVKDITERKRAEHALRESEQRLRLALTASSAGTWSWDVRSNRATWDEHYHELYGFAPDAPRAFETWLASVHPEDRPHLQHRLATLLESTSDDDWSEEFRAFHPVKGERWISGRGKLERDGDGHPIRMTGINIDVTTRKHSEEAVQASDQMLRLHFEQTPTAVIEWDLEFRVARWNPTAEAMFGFTREEALGQHAAFIVPEEYRDHVDQVWQALLKRSGGERSSNENVRKDGRKIVCEWYNTPLIDEHGGVAGVASIVMDITERIQAQQTLAWEKSALELIGSAASLREVLDRLMLGLEKQSPGALCSILLLDEDGVHLRHGAAPSIPDAYNRAIDGATIGPNAGSCGTAAHENRQVIVSDIASDPLWADYRDLALGHGLRACWSTPIHGSSGEILGTFAIYYRETRQPIPAEFELIARVAHVARIAIERKQAEENIRALNADLERRVEERTSELKAANKELEAFTYSVSHDLRAPLRTMDGFSRLVAKNYASLIDDKGREMLDMIRGGARQMGRLINDLLAFSRIGRQPIEPEAIDMHAMARKVFDELAALDPARTLRLALHPLPAALGTKAMIRQVWVNLISNAIKFTKEREVAQIEIGAETGADGAQIYYVKDNGAGFDEEHSARLFGVFQRLHSAEEFEGTGVGLALVLRIVQRHGGWAWASGEVDRGAKFSFTLLVPKG